MLASLGAKWIQTINSMYAIDCLMDTTFTNYISHRKDGIVFNVHNEQMYLKEDPLVGRK